MSGAKLNRTVLSIFAPILILAGISGFVIPEQYSLTSGAAPYNMFHIVLGDRNVYCFNWRDGVSSFLQYRVWPYRSLPGGREFLRTVAHTVFPLDFHR